MRASGLVVFLAVPLACLGQVPVITSIAGNGTVAWTNAADTAAVYRIEWASSANGPWKRSLQGIDLIEGRSNSLFSAAVPMFYRVVLSSNLPPSGMALVDAGESVMGQAGMTEPIRTNFISAVWIDRYETSKTRWDQVRNWALTNGYTDLAAGDAGWNDNLSQPAGQSNHPVVNVNWYDCVKWCNARSQKEGLTPVYYTSDAHDTVYRTGTNNLYREYVDWTANGYRLPTEAEWEKAARGGLAGHCFPWPSPGTNYPAYIDGGKANYSGSGDPFDEGTTPVGYCDGNQVPAGSDMANGFGLYDMAGNVWEWCWDWSGSNPEEYQIDPVGPDAGTTRVQRGGSWGNHDSYHLQCAYHGANSPALAYIHHGFRCVRRY